MADKVLEPSNFGALRRSARIASRKAARSDDLTGLAGISRNRLRHFSELHPRAPQSSRPGSSQGALPRDPPRVPPPRPRRGVKPVSQIPHTEDSPKQLPSVPLAPRMTWRQQLQERLEFWRDERERAEEQDDPHQISSYNALQDTDVVSAIASVWRPLIDWGTSYAFASAFHLQTARLYSGSGVAFLPPPNAFVIPLIFNELIPATPPEAREYSMPPPAKEPAEDPEAAKRREESSRHVAKVNETRKDPNAQTQAPKAKNKTAEEVKAAEERKREFSTKNTIGHFVLAVAERVASSVDGVRLRFWDSAPGAIDEGSIRGTARQIVRNSAWMPPNVWPKFVEDEEWVDSPRQIASSCGLHVILNAWAYMLNIPLNRRVDLNLQFYDDACEIINLALRGLMDATTIRAFLHAYGYAARRGFEEVERQETLTMPDVPREMHHLPQTTLVNEDILNRWITHLQDLAATQSDAEGNTDPPGPTAPGRKSQKRPTPPGPTDGPPSHGGSTPAKPPSPRERTLSNNRSPSKNPSPSKPPSSRKRTPPKQGPSSLKTQKAPPGKTSSPTKGSTTAESHRNSPRRTWEQILEAGLTQQRNAAKNSKKPASYSLSTVESNALDDEDVGYAIASVWAGLRNSGTYFGFGTPNTFRVYSKPPGRDAAASPAVGGPNPLIMLLLSGNSLTLQDDEFGGIGHFVLAIAEMDGPSGNDVKIYIVNSAPGLKFQDDPETAARCIVRYSGWMGVNVYGVPLNKTPNFTARSTPQVPHQKEINNCGVHVILNAWAVMLRIPIEASPERRPTTWRGHATSDSEFYRLGKEIMNLAVHGFMDSTTIQAFMMVFGYAVYRPAGDPEHAARFMQSVEMNGRILEDLMQAIREEEGVRASELEW